MHISYYGNKIFEASHTARLEKCKKSCFFRRLPHDNSESMKLIQKSLCKVEGQVMLYLFAEFDRNHMIMKNVTLEGFRKSSPTQFLCHRTSEVEAQFDHGKPKREMSAFTTCASLLMLPHLNTKAVTVHLPLFRLLQTRANSIRRRPSYESPNWSVRIPQASEMRNVHFYG
jgi:hypothetical protein